MKLYKQYSFTLIEMLIVIVIIGILAAALVPRLQSIQSRARDTKRKTDLKQIYTAAEIYYTDAGDYPPALSASGSCPVDTVCSAFSYQGTNWLTGFTGFMTSYPIDPINIVANTAES